MRRWTKNKMYIFVENQDKVDTKTIKIYIEELGPIRDSVIELKPFMIFLENQEWGKVIRFYWFIIYIEFCVMRLYLLF